MVCDMPLDSMLIADKDSVCLPKKQINLIIIKEKYIFSKNILWKRWNCSIEEPRVGLCDMFHLIGNHTNGYPVFYCKADAL